MNKLLCFLLVVISIAVTFAAELPVDSGKILYCKTGQVADGVVSAEPNSPGSSVFFRPVPSVKIPAGGVVSVELTLLEGIRQSSHFMFMYRGVNEKVVIFPSGKTFDLPLNKRICLNFPTRHAEDLTTSEYRLYFNHSKATSVQPVKFKIHRISVTAAAKEEKEQSVTKIPLEKRERVFPKTLIYPRIQSKYSLVQNYLDSYCRIIFTDRPLFFNRSLAGENTWEYNKLNVPGSLISQFRTAMEFADGLGILFGGGASYNRVCRAVDYLNQSDLRGVLWAETVSIPTPETEARYFDVIDRMMASPAVSKPNGKLIISSYHGEKCPPEEWKRHIAKLRERYGDKIMAMVEMRSTCYRLASSYRLNRHSIPAAEIESAKNTVRQYLDVADGINFSGSNHIYDYGDKDSFPDYRFFSEAYANIIVPLLVSVINEPPYRNKKILGLSAHKIYFYRLRPMDSLDEEGTRALRRSLEIALAANPDYIVMPEWNEINENTHIEPTVSDSRTNIRVVNAVTGRETPEKSRKMPSFILSFRQDNALGDPLPVEFLALPDQHEPDRNYTVKLRFLTPAGKPVYDSSEHSFNQVKIQDRFFMIPTEEFASYRYLVPELTIVENGMTRVVSTGLPHVRLCLSPNLNLKYVKIPLRDLPDPERVAVSWQQMDGQIKVSGKVALESPVNTIELLADDIPLAAVDPRNEYQPPAGQVLLRLYRFTPSVISNLHASDRYRITAVDGKLTGRKIHQIALSGMAAPVQDGNTLRGVFGAGAFSREIWFYATPDAVMEIECGGQTVKVSVKDLLKNGIYRKTLEYGICWGMEIVRELPEVPYPINNAVVEFNLRTQPADRENPVYTLRVITMDGGVYRSLPFFPEENSENTVTVPIYDRRHRAVRQVEIPYGLTKRIQYRFSPDCGDILLAEPARREHHALIGGYSYYRHSHLKKDGNVRYTAAEWQTRNGKPVLHFTEGQYLMLPPPVFSKGAFVIEMDFRLDDLHEQFLLNSLTGIFHLKIVKGKMSGQLKTNHGSHSLAVADMLWEAGREYRLEISYDLAHLTLKLNGGIIGRYPVTGSLPESPLLIISPHGTLSGLAVGNSLSEL